MKVLNNLVRRNISKLERKYSYLPKLKSPICGKLSREDCVVLLHGKLICMHGRKLTTKGGKVFRVKFADKEEIIRVMTTHDINNEIALVGYVKEDTLICTSASAPISAYNKIKNKMKYEQDRYVSEFYREGADVVGLTWKNKNVSEAKF